MPSTVQQLFSGPDGMGGLGGDLFCKPHGIGKRSVAYMGDESQLGRFLSIDYLSRKNQFLRYIQGKDVTNRLAA